jgi:DNA-directed RNA polymerase sigma subunit (sigma70/sigma32)
MLNELLDKAYKAGLTYAEIGNALGLTRQRIQQLKNNASDNNNKHTEALITAARAQESDSLRWSEIIDD